MTSRKCSLQVTRKLSYRRNIFHNVSSAASQPCDYAVILSTFCTCFQLISCAISCAQHSFCRVFLLVYVILHHAPYYYALSITARQKSHNRNNPITPTKSPSLTKSDGLGADSGNRTHDLFITSEPLYRLSHISIQGARCLIPA